MPVLDCTPSGPMVALLAEDDSDDVVLIRRAVSRLGIVDQLMVVRSGEEVLSYLEGHLHYADRCEHPFPNFIFLDHFMPGWSGLDVLLWIRSSRRFERLPVVLLSTGLSPAQLEAAQLLRAATCEKSPALKELPWAVKTAAEMLDPDPDEECLVGPMPRRIPVTADLHA